MSGTLGRFGTLGRLSRPGVIRFGRGSEAVPNNLFCALVRLLRKSGLRGCVDKSLHLPVSRVCGVAARVLDTLMCVRGGSPPMCRESVGPDGVV